MKQTIRFITNTPVCMA